MERVKGAYNITSRYFRARYVFSLESTWMLFLLALSLDPFLDHILVHGPHIPFEIIHSEQQSLSRNDSFCERSVYEIVS